MILVRTIELSIITNLEKALYDYSCCNIKSVLTPGFFSSSVIPLLPTRLMAYGKGWTSLMIKFINIDRMICSMLVHDEHV
jgi:hypothetical protein